MEQLLECYFQDSQPDHERSAASGPPTSIDQARRSAVPILIAGGLLFMGEGGGGRIYGFQIINYDACMSSYNIFTFTTCLIHTYGSDYNCGYNWFH